MKNARAQAILRTPRPKRCAICSKPVTKADLDAKVARRKKFGLRWQHLHCKGAASTTVE